MNIAAMVYMGVGSVTGLICIVLLIVYYRAFEYFVKEANLMGISVRTGILPIGYGLARIFKLKKRVLRNEGLNRKMVLLYGKKAEYELMIMLSQQCTYFAGVPFCCVLTGLIIGFKGNDINYHLLFLVLLLLLGVMAYDKTFNLNKQSKETKEAIDNELPNVITKFSILAKAGVTISEAWKRVAYSKDGKIYEEMRAAYTNMLNGMPEKEAYGQFGIRCDVPKVKEFVSNVQQNLEKGNNNMGDLFRDMSQRMWTEKKNRAKVCSDRAKEKLMMPMVLVFIAVLIQLLVPIMNYMSQI